MASTNTPTIAAKAGSRRAHIAHRRPARGPALHRAQLDPEEPRRLGLGQAEPGEAVAKLGRVHVSLTAGP